MPLKGILEAVFDYDGIHDKWMEYLSAHPDSGTRQQMEKLCELFSPLDKDYHPNLPVGYTPLIECPNLRLKPLSEFDGVNQRLIQGSCVLSDGRKQASGIREILRLPQAAASSLAALSSAGLKAVILLQPMLRMQNWYRSDSRRWNNMQLGTYDDACQPWTNAAITNA
jgi:hypothetical protein